MTAEQLDKVLKDCAKNNRKAQQQLYYHCFPFLMSICVRYFNNEEDARACLNGGFLKILNHLRNNNTKIEYFNAWIKKIMINTIIDEHRATVKYKSTVQLNGGYIEQHGMELIDWNDAEQNMDANSILELVRELPQAESKIFNLYAIDGFKHFEIAEMLNIPLGTSKWLLSSARKKLSKQLELLMSHPKSLVK